jgi:uncharacterized protein YkwD
MLPLTALDLVFLLVVVWFTIGGMRRGFVLSAFDLVVLAATLVVATTEFHAAGTLIAQRLGWSSSVSDLVGFAGIILLGEIVRSIGAALIGGALAPIYGAVPLVRYVDQLAGLVAGAIRGALYFAIAIIAVEGLGLAPSLQNAAQESPISGRVVPAVASVAPSLDEVFGGVVNLQPSALPEPAPGTAYRLPIPSGVDASVSPSSEDDVLQMTNLARRQNGLTPYVADADLTEVARQHSLEMFHLAYFAHDSPTYGTPVDRLRRAGIDYGVAGENIAYAPSVALAFRGLMQSPEHRDNILSPDFRRIGIGVAQSGLWGFLVTQDFTD